MKLYISTICIAMLIISAINMAFRTNSWYYILIAVFWCTVLQIVLDGAVAFLINKLPDKWFGVDNPIFSVSKKELDIYKKIKVREWKDKVLELGILGGFSKRKVKEPYNKKYIEKFIVECNKGVVTHRISYPIGFLVMFTIPGVCSFTIALPVALVNLYLSILPTIVLRYNTYALKSLFERMRRKEMAKRCENVFYSEVKK